MLKLIQNEFIKIFGQLGWKFSAIFILVIAVGVAPYTKMNTPDYLYERTGSVSTHKANYESLKNQYENTEEDGIEKSFTKCQMEIEKFYADNNIDTDGWKGDYAYTFKTLYKARTMLSLLENGCTVEELTDTPFNPNGGEPGGIYYDSFSENYFYLRILSLTATSIEYDTEPYDKEKLPDYIKDTQGWLDKVTKILTSGKEEYAKEQADSARQTLSEEKKRLEEAKAVYEQDKSKPHDYYTLLNRCEALEIFARCWDRFSEVSEENEDAVFSCLSYDFEHILDFADRFAPNDKSYFDYSSVYYSETWQNRRVANYGSYEEYIDDYAEKANEDYISAAKAILYITENEVFPKEYDRLSTRINFNDFMTVNIYVIMFFTIFMAAVIMSSEFGSGAIRLLVIRPCLRWKLLLSKLLTVIIFCAAMLLVTTGLTLASTVIFYGWGDMSEPYFEFASGTAREISPIVYTFRGCLLDVLSMFGVAALAFFLGVIFKRGVFSIAVSTLIFAFGTLVSKISWDFIYHIPFLKYTPIPYLMNLNNVRNDAVLRIENWYNPIGADYGLDFQTGVIVTMVVTFLLLAGSFVIFDKKQIK